MTTQIVCETCGKDMEQATEYGLEEGIKEGRYVKGARMVTGTKYDGEEFTTTKTGVWGVCKKCARLAQTEPDKDGLAQSRRIQARIAAIRAKFPRSSLKKVARIAVDDEFNPNNEPNMAFRAYLLDHAAKDEASDATAREFLADLDGPKAGGAA